MTAHDIEDQVRAAILGFPSVVAKDIKIDGLRAELVRRKFPEATRLTDWSVSLTLTLPVRYDYSNGETGPADETTLDDVKRAVEGDLLMSSTLVRPRIIGWEATPEKIEAPEPGSPGQHWTIAARIKSS